MAVTGNVISAETEGEMKQVIGELEIHMLDMAYQPKAINVPAAGRYRLKVQNTSPTDHDIIFSNGQRAQLRGALSTSLFIDVPETGLVFHCSLPGHKQAGMEGIVSVNGHAAQAIPETPVAHVHDGSDPEYKDPRAPLALVGKIHDIYLVAVEKKVNVAKGTSQQLWTYNGQAPGPVFRVHVGDTVRMHLSNAATNKLSHSIDFHSSQVAWNDEMTSIKPGEDKVYQWSADYAGVWMYHCGTNPALHHIASGMYGMVIVEPEEGLSKVDYEFAIVQSDFYLGSAGGETDLHKASAGHPSPDLVVFNGAAFQYKDHPIEVETGKKIRFFVLNAGPNVDSVFHIVGTIFNRVIKEGVELVAGNKGNWGSQSVDLAPSQGAIVELTTKEDGLYPIVTHAFNFVGKGALGLLKSGDGDPKNDDASNPM